MKGEKILNLAYSIASQLNKNKTKAVMFISFGGQYNDNPKYISELLQ